MKDLTIGFVVGNGESRKGLNLQALKDSGILVGCNRIYTEIEPDIICALDEPMRKEILEQNLSSSFIGSIAKPARVNCRDTVIQDINYALISNSIDLTPCRDNYPTCCYNSGVTGLIVTSYLPGIKKIYLLGFDFYHNYDSPKNNNLYNDQISIRPDNYENVINEVLAACNPNVEIYVVKKAGDEEFHEKLNISGTISYKQFHQIRANL